MMQILGLLGMYFDAVIVFVTNSTLLFRLAMAILWLKPSRCNTFVGKNENGFKHVFRTCLVTILWPYIKHSLFCLSIFRK